MEEFRTLIYNGEEHPAYGINSKGEVLSRRTGRLKKPTKNARGYWVCNLYHSKGIRIHKALAETWLPNPENLSDVNHIDGDTGHLELSNLEWLTHSENVRRAYADGYAVYKTGPEHHCSKLTEDDIAFIKANYRYKDPVYNSISLARKYGVSSSTILHHTKRKTNNALSKSKTMQK